MNIFEAARNILSAETNLLQKQEMFFTDYSIMPLFVQENYPNVRGPKMKYAILRFYANYLNNDLSTVSINSFY